MSIRRDHAGGLVRSVRAVPIVPLILLVPLVVFGLIGPLLSPHDPLDFDPARALLPPVWLEGSDPAFLLGTDHAGRDLLTRMMLGARNSLIVAVAGVLLAGFLGVLLGMLAGIRGGRIDALIMRLVDMQLAVPPILLGILVGAATGGGLTAVVLVVAVSFWPSYARVVRGETLSLTNREYVALAKVAGASRQWILRKHIFPNLFGLVVVLIALQLGIAIVLESALSFLGLGLRPPAASWGLMIAAGRIHLSNAWWVSTLPGLAIVSTVLGANLLGDWLRDRLDPRMRQT